MINLATELYCRYNLAWGGFIWSGEPWDCRGLRCSRWGRGFCWPILLFSCLRPATPYPSGPKMRHIATSGSRTPAGCPYNSRQVPFWGVCHSSPCCCAAAPTRPQCRHQPSPFPHNKLHRLRTPYNNTTTAQHDPYKSWAGCGRCWGFAGHCWLWVPAGSRSVRWWFCSRTDWAKLVASWIVSSVRLMYPYCVLNWVLIFQLKVLIYTQYYMWVADFTTMGPLVLGIIYIDFEFMLYRINISW